MQYGMLYGTCGLTFFIGSYVCGQSIHRLGILNTLFIGLAINASGALLMLLGYLCFQTTHILLIHPAIILMIWGASFMVGAGIGGTMAPFKDIPGTTFAMISCYKFIGAHSVGDVVMYFYNGTPVSLAITILLLNILSSGLLYYYQKGITYNRQSTVSDSISE